MRAKPRSSLGFWFSLAIVPTHANYCGPCQGFS